MIGSIVVGGRTANYLAAVFGHVVGLSSETSGFVVGLAGTIVCKALIESAVSWRLIKWPKDQ